MSDASRPAAATARRIMVELEKCRFRFASETDLQAGIAQAMDAAGLAYEREKVLTATDRPDFVVEDRIVLEIKIQGSIAAALRQVDRYTRHASIDTVLLVGTPHWLHRVPSEIGGKPVLSLRLTGSLL